MRFNILLSLSLATFSLASPDRLGGLIRRDVCTDNAEVDCEQSCMPAGSVCCNDGSSTYCDSGDTCIPGGCCPVGQECSGPGGTQTFFLTGTGVLPTDTVVPKQTSKAGGQSASFTAAPLDTSTSKAAGGGTAKTTATAGGATATHSAASGGTTAAIQLTSGGKRLGSEIYAIAVVAVGQFLLM
jgi:hypothetical protein